MWKQLQINLEEGNPNSKLGSIVQCIRDTSHRDTLAKSIVLNAHKILHNPMEDQMGISDHFCQSSGLGYLHLRSQTSHLLFSCEFSRKVLLATFEILGQSILKIGNYPISTTLHSNVCIRDIIGACQKYTQHSACWGLHWNMLGSLSWHLWAERNRRLKNQTLRPPEIKVFTS